MTTRFANQSHGVRGGVKFPQDSWGVAPVKKVVVDPEISLAATASLEVLELITELKALAKQEAALDLQKSALQKQDIDLLFVMGEKVNSLHEKIPYGDYKLALAQTGLSWSSANRKWRAWQLFDQYKLEPWIYCFGKSALQQLGYYYYQHEGSEEARALVDEAIALAQRGVEIGVAWVFARTGNKRNKKPVKRRSRLTGRIRELIFEAIQVVGEVEVEKALNNLLEEKKND